MQALERIVDPCAGTGEGPLWHPGEAALFWVDIPVGVLYRYDPETGENAVAYETDDSPLGGFTIEDDGCLLLFEHGVVRRLQPGSVDADPVVRVDSSTRFNDVIADPEGRVFCGTMPGENALGDLYRIDPDGTVQVVLENVDIPNGMGFTTDEETFYFTESEANRIYAFDYDRTTGEISAQRTFVETPPDDGVPDGMTVDENGHIWSARWNGGRILRYDSTGAVRAEYELPARKVSSVTFGGSKYADLYVTTALDGGTRDAEGDGAGVLFRVPGSEIDAAGVPEFRSRIGIE